MRETKSLNQVLEEEELWQHYQQLGKYH